MISFKSRSLKTLAYSFYIVLLDQVSKFLVLSTLGFERSKNIIPNLLNFTLVKNKGAAFSLFSNSTNFLTITSVIASLFLITICIFNFMSLKNLFVYDSIKLFEILNEINDNFSFKVNKKFKLLDKKINSKIKLIKLVYKSKNLELNKKLNFESGTGSQL